MTKFAKQRDTLAENELLWGPGADEAVAGPFRYLHLGSLAYIGNAAVFDLGKLSFMGGLVAMYAWRSVYWSEQVSSRTRALLMIDWIVRCVSMFLCVLESGLLMGMIGQGLVGARFVEIVKSDGAAAGHTHEYLCSNARLVVSIRTIDLRHLDALCSRCYLG